MKTLRTADAALARAPAIETYQCVRRSWSNWSSDPLATTYAASLSYSSPLTDIGIVVRLITRHGDDKDMFVESNPLQDVRLRTSCDTDTFRPLLMLTRNRRQPADISELNASYSCQKPEI